MTKKLHLLTQLRFERATPDSLRVGQPHARFVEWLMGYPLNFSYHCLPESYKSSETWVKTQYVV